MNFIFYLLSILFIELFGHPQSANAMVLTKDTTWRGEVRLTEDMYVPSGVTLTIMAGTTIRIVASESTKIDPEFLSPLTEIVVRGHLEVEGEADKTVTFILDQDREPQARWAGIIFDGGNGFLQWIDVSGAETAVTVIRGSVKLNHAKIHDNLYGLVAGGQTSGIKYELSDITANDYGVMLFDQAVCIDQGSRVEENRKNNFFRKDTRSTAEHTGSPPKTDPLLSRVYNNETLLGTTLWRGKIQVKGIVRVEIHSKLVIAPGTVIEFIKHDANNDGIGENGLFIQGLIFAKGTPEEPIIFRSAEKAPKRGDWDAINIMNSDRGQNLIEYCHIQDAYRGLHFHFSNIAVKNTTLAHNFRGVQFQESLVELSDCRFLDNINAIQARDSEVRFFRNELADNYSGANFYRLTMTAAHNRFQNNQRDGIRVREGAVTFTNNLVAKNRFGLLITDAVYGSFIGNTIEANDEVGLALRNDDNLEIRGNMITDNGLSGIRVQDSRCLITGNHIAGNGERGVGILSFSGTISGNNICENGRYGIELEGKKPVAAPDNWWGGLTPEAAIFDQNDDPNLGKVTFEPVRKEKVVILKEREEF